MNQLDQILKRLKSSPLFYLFLSSRELFHSNFWFWLSELDRTEASKLFSDRISDGEIKFEREHNQRSGIHKAKIDLYVVDKLVIENKTKDFPTAEQLHRIKKSFGDKKLEFVLCTLFWTNDLSFAGWNVKTYRQLSDAIVPSKFTPDTYHQSIIRDYKEFTLNLADLAEQLEITQSYDFSIHLNGSLYNKLNEMKLWEGYQKLRASHLLIHFEKSNTHKAITRYGVHHQKATIDFLINVNDSYRMGIQLENNQYRKFVEGPKATQFAENLILNNIFLTNTFIGRGKKPYLNYGGVFKYQYTAINSIISFDDLFKKINGDIQLIQHDINKIKEYIPSN